MVLWGRAKSEARRGFGVFAQGRNICVLQAATLLFILFCSLSKRAGSNKRYLFSQFEARVCAYPHNYADTKVYFVLPTARTGVKSAF